MKVHSSAFLQHINCFSVMAEIGIGQSAQWHQKSTGESTGEHHNHLMSCRLTWPMHGPPSEVSEGCCHQLNYLCTSLPCIWIQAPLALPPPVIQSTCWQWELSCTDPAPPEDLPVHGNSFLQQLSQFFWFALHCYSGTEHLLWLLWLTESHSAAQKNSTMGADMKVDVSERFALA